MKTNQHECGRFYFLYVPAFVQFLLGVVVEQRDGRKVILGTALENASHKAGLVFISYRNL
jgi:hypothetical protein